MAKNAQVVIVSEFSGCSDSLLRAGIFSITFPFFALVMVAFTVAVTLGSKTGWNDAAFGALVAAFPNTGFMGMPLLVALLRPIN